MLLASLPYYSYAMEMEDRSTPSTSQNHLRLENGPYDTYENQTFAELTRPIRPERSYTNFVDRLIRGFYKTHNLSVGEYVKNSAKQKSQNPKMVFFRMIKEEYLTEEYQKGFFNYFQGLYELDSSALEAIRNKFYNIDQIVEEEEAQIVGRHASVTKDLTKMSFSQLISINVKNNSRFADHLTSKIIRAILKDLKEKEEISFGNVAEVLEKDYEKSAKNSIRFEILKPRYLIKVCENFWDYIKEQKEIKGLALPVQQEIQDRLQNPSNFKKGMNVVVEEDNALDVYSGDFTKMSFTQLISINTKNKGANIGSNFISRTVTKILHDLKKNKIVSFETVSDTFEKVYRNRNNPNATRIRLEMLQPAYLQKVCKHFWDYIKDAENIRSLEESAKKEIQSRLGDPGSFKKNLSKHEDEIKVEKKPKNYFEKHEEEKEDRRGDSVSADEQIKKGENLFEEDDSNEEVNPEIFGAFCHA